MKQKIFHVVRQFHPSIGGLEDVVLNIARAQLETADQTPVVVTLNRIFRSDSQALLPSEEVVEGIRVIRLPYFGSERYPLCFKVLGAIREADVVHVHGVDFFYDFLAWTRPLHGKPLVASTHGIFFHTEFASKAKQVYFNVVTRLSTLFYRKIYATSDNDGRLYAGIASGRKVKVIENGVDVDKFKNPRTALNKQIIYFGRWSENKGLPEALAFFARLVAADPEWRLVIAGREYDLSEPDLRQLADHLQIQDKIAIHTSPSLDRLKSLVAASSYFICLSRHEGFGLAAIEAMSGGLIPILSDIPPFRKLHERIGAGFIYEGEASAAEQLLADSNLSEAAHLARVNAMCAQVEVYSWKSVASAYIDEYRALA